MAIGARNSMNLFEAGVQGGQVKSNAYGIGNAIRGMLQQGNKLGLIGAQSGGALATGLATAQYKNQLSQPVGFPDGVVPEAVEEGGLIKYPAYNTRGVATGGFDFKSKPVSPVSIFSGPGGEIQPPLEQFDVSDPSVVGRGDAQLTPEQILGAIEAERIRRKQQGITVQGI